MQIYGLTDIGKKRSNNQDCFKTVSLTDTAVLLVVCDGMGGANAGNIASELATEMIINQIKASYRDDMSVRSLKNMMVSAVSAANITVFDKALSDDSLSGMGTTAVVTLIVENNAYIAHVGDSRAYIVNPDISPKIEQITTDHSIVQLMVESGQITSDEAKSHPKRNIITRAVGVNDKVAVDFEMRTLEKNDVVLLCTDGLTNYVTNEKIFEIINITPPVNVPQILIDTANENGGNDNITAVIAVY